jgi:hypothetical protein
MDFYFPILDSAFHWVRASSLYSSAARQRQVSARTFFRDLENIGASIPVFNRSDINPFYLKLHSLCISSGVPYLADLDDLYWETPGFSQDPVLKGQERLAFLDTLVKHAAAVIASTSELKEKLGQRFPDKPLFLVDNSPPAWVAPRYGVLIANTDSFKMGREHIRWFADLLRLLFQHGLSIQLLGHNENLLDQCSDILVHSLPPTDYRSYLLTLATSNFRLGLIPVEHSSYADCKSAIKAIEFLSQRIPVIASDVAPYRRLSGLHGMKHFHVVPNTLESWRQAAEAEISRIPEAEREEGKEINLMLLAARDTQLRQWLSVADFLRDLLPAPETMHQVSAKMQKWSRRARSYESVKKVLRPIVAPVRTLWRKKVALLTEPEGY